VFLRGFWFGVDLDTGSKRSLSLKALKGLKKEII